MKRTTIIMGVLNKLSKQNEEVHLEDIAHECYKIIPELFKWEKFDFPSRLYVGRTLRRMRQDGYVAGSKLWRLTPLGQKWIEDNQHLLRILENITTPQPTPVVSSASVHP